MTEPMRTLGVRIGPELYGRLEAEAGKRDQSPSELARDLLAVELVPAGQYVKVAAARRREKIAAYRAEIDRPEAEETKLRNRALALVLRIVATGLMGESETEPALAALGNLAKEIRTKLPTGSAEPEKVST